MCKVSQVVGWMLELCPMMSHVGQSRRFRDAPEESGSPPRTDMRRQQLRLEGVTVIVGDR
jgi:hypothetical protein